MTSSFMNMQMQDDKIIRRSCDMCVVCLQLHSDRRYTKVKQNNTGNMENWYMTVD